MVNAAIALAIAAVSAGQAAAAGQVFQLASAQVVPSTSGAPLLRVAANGPIAYEVEPAGDGSTGHLQLRLHGVAPKDGFVSTDLTPYYVQVQAVGDSGTRLIIWGPVGHGQWQVRSSNQSNEIEITFVAQ